MNPSASDLKPNLRCQDAINEVRVLSSLKHPYIVSEPESGHLLNIGQQLFTCRPFHSTRTLFEAPNGVMGQSF